MKKHLLLLTLCLLGCSQVDTTIPNYEYPNELLISWSDSFSQKENDYLVYFFSESCGYCERFKNEFLEYIYKKKPVCYFVNTATYCVIKQNTEQLIGISKIEDLFIPGTPTLISISNYTISNYYAGVTAIEIFIENN